jgi:hypothetical protein
VIEICEIKLPLNFLKGQQVASLPYITSPGNIDKAFKGIQAAATPERVSQDFVKTILHIPGGSGSQMTTFLKKIGFTNPDGAPSDLYRRFRNPSTAGKAAAEAIKIGFKPLYIRNEYMHQLGDEKLKGLLIEETGLSHDSNVVTMVFACIKSMKKFANFANETEADDPASTSSMNEPIVERSGSSINFPMPQEAAQSLGLNLSYTINLNLPATSDIAVFNAIFKSLKENLLKAGNE